MLTFRLRLLATSRPPPDITSRAPRVSQPLPAPVPGVERASTAPVGVGVLDDPSTPSVGLGLGDEGSDAQPRTLTKPEASVAWLRPSLPLNGAHRSSW